MTKMASVQRGSKIARASCLRIKKAALPGAPLCDFFECDESSSRLGLTRRLGGFAFFAQDDDLGEAAAAAAIVDGHLGVERFVDADAGLG